MCVEAHNISCCESASQLNLGIAALNSPCGESTGANLVTALVLTALMRTRTNLREISCINLHHNVDSWHIMLLLLRLKRLSFLRHLPLGWTLYNHSFALLKSATLCLRFLMQLRYSVV